LAVGSALAKYWKNGRVILGHDARLSSPSLYGILREVFGADKNFEVEEVGLMTTPMLYFLKNKLKAVGGIMVTASHNPKEYNGMKVMGKRGIMNGKEIQKLVESSK
jgi:phosphomannomutase